MNSGKTIVNYLECEMDYKVVLEFMLRDFNKAKLRYGLIGGFALGLWGVPRATVDLDFLIHQDDLQKVDAIMKSHDYACVHKSENASQYVSTLTIFGEIDFLHAFREATLGMLKRAAEKRVFAQTLPLKVLMPEDIIGLKVQAAVNNPARNIREFLDIEALIELHGRKLDWQLLEDYFSLFKQREKFVQLKRKYYET